MRLLLALVVSATVAAAPSSAASGDYAKASVTPPRAGRTATLRVSLHTELQCGRLRPGRAFLRVPARMLLPAAPVVRVDEAPVGNATVAGHVLTFSILPSAGLTCTAIAPGTVTLTVAGVRNPAAGRYAVVTTVAGRTFRAKLVVSA